MALFNMHQILERAKSSSFYLWLLNLGLSRMIPFNRPHGIKIVNISNDSLYTFLPFKKSNLNHIRSLHACSMATIAEFTTGFLLVSRIDTKQYRLVMKKISMEYFYQGKMDAHVHFVIDENWFEKAVTTPLQNEGLAEIDCEVEVKDKESNTLAKGKVSWQLKSWEKVKTSV